MRSFVPILSLVVISGFLIINTNACRRRRHHSNSHSDSYSVSESIENRVTCPKFNDFEAVSGSCPRSSLYSYEWVERLWNTPFPKISHKAAALRDATMAMAASDVPRWNHVASTLTFWVWSMLPLIGRGLKPNNCGFAKIINATIYSNGGPLDCNLLSDALEDVVDTVYDGSKYISRISRINAGCFPGENPEPTARTCYNNGFSYDSRAFWNIKRDFFTRSFRKAVRALSKSSHFQDRFIGTIAHAVTTQPMISLYENYDMSVLYQAFTLLTVPKINEFCCKNLFEDIEETSALAYPAADFARRAALVESGCAPTPTTTPIPITSPIPTTTPFPTTIPTTTMILTTTQAPITTSTTQRPIV